MNSYFKKSSERGYLMIKIILVLLLIACARFSKKDFKEPASNTLPLAPLDIPKEIESKFKVMKQEKENQELKIPARKTIQNTSVKKEIKKSIKIDDNPKVIIQADKVKKFSYAEDFPKILKDMDLKYSGLWENLSIPFQIGESQFIDIYYLGAKVGKIYLELRPDAKINGSRAYSFYARLKSSSFYSYIYALDDKITSFVKKDNFLPIKYHLHQEESKKVVDDIQLFDREKSRLYFRYFREKRKKIKKKNKDFYIPRYAMDAFSALYFIRSLPLKQGESYRFPVVTREKIWEMSLVNKEEEIVSTPLGPKKCMRVEITTEYEGDLTRKGVMNIWLTKDENRYLAKFKAKVKIGSVRGVTSEYTAGSQ